MASPGLSLVGFLGEEQGTNYLRAVCIPRDSSANVLRAEWEAARAALGPPPPRAGRPVIKDLPAEYDDYLRALREAPWLTRIFQEGWDVRVIEIAPLLAYQFHVDTNRAAALSTGLSRSPSVREQVLLCLPATPPTLPVQVVPNEHSLLLKSSNLNMRIGDKGVFQGRQDVAGIEILSAAPMIQVVRYRGRCYMRNGYHRAFGLMKAGVTHLPCCFRDVTDIREFGVTGGGATFDLDLLESDNPPTCGHFRAGIAHPVTLRSATRIIHVSWAEYVVADE